MSGVNAIPTFGAANGVSGNPPDATANAAVDTIFAVMYNYYDPTLLTDNTGSIVTNSSNRIVLNPYGVNPVDASNTTVNNGVNGFDMISFLNLFYATNAGYFNVNPTNGNNPAIILSKQTYSSTNSDSNNFSLIQFLLRAYATNKGISVNDIDPRVVILLQKETFPVQSLASVKGTVISLSWDEVINSLVRSGVMDASGNLANSSSAHVPLTLILNYHSFVLDIDLAIKFTYLVDITGYALPLIPPAQPTYNSTYQTIA